ncbi:unnamed protein product [Somion occarium]|uniref:SH3 domain-containing protein n=1 Tax=Somion occarium TaxID=3059160 RepID=A0ABP1D209_9APHY
MAFTATDKQAFFAILDEYFSSRPNLVVSEASSENPQTLSSPNTARNAQALASSMQSSSQSDLPSSAGRVAAAAAAFKFNQSPSQNPSAPPRPPFRQTPSQSSESEQEPGHQRASLREEPHVTSGRLLAQKKFGDVDMSSGKNMLMSLKHSNTNKSAAPPEVAPPTPAAFAHKKSTFAPPPVRHVSATSPPPSRSASTVESPAPAPPVPPSRRAPAKEEPQGEWAEALYDYSSEDPGDLQLQENERVLVVERNSDDWWTGEIEGRRGLFPAAYVKLL